MARAKHFARESGVESPEHNSQGESISQTKNKKKTSTPLQLHESPKYPSGSKQTFISVSNLACILTFISNLSLQINTLKSGDLVLKSKLHLHRMKKNCTHHSYIP